MKQINSSAEASHMKSNQDPWQGEPLRWPLWKHQFDYLLKRQIKLQFKYSVARVIKFILTQVFTVILMRPLQQSENKNMYCTVCVWQRANLLLAAVWEALLSSDQRTATVGILDIYSLYSWRRGDEKKRMVVEMMWGSGRQTLIERKGKCWTAANAW